MLLFLPALLLQKVTAESLQQGGPIRRLGVGAVEVVDDQDHEAAAGLGASEAAIDPGVAGVQAIDTVQEDHGRMFALFRRLEALDADRLASADEAVLDGAGLFITARHRPSQQ